MFLKGEEHFGGDDDPDLVFSEEPHMFFQTKTPLFICYTLEPPASVIKRGISIMKVVIGDHPTKLPTFDIFIHQKNSLMIDLPRRAKEFQLDPSQTIRKTIEHEIISQLDFNGTKCISDPDYNYDECILDVLHDKNLKLFECSIPGSNAPVCTDRTLSKNATYTFTNSRPGGCNYPCTYLDISTREESMMNSNQIQGSTLIIKFNKIISVTESYYSYTELELLAEFGGYVGLFLGLSVFDLSRLLEQIFLKSKIGN